MVFRQAAVNLVRHTNKLTINRLTLKLAGGPLSPFSIVRHTGRRTGKPYSTPVIVEPVGESLVIALTYGPETDWCRNILAAGSCVIRRRGREYACFHPELTGGKSALPAFPIVLRTILRILGTSQFLIMDVRK